MLRFYDVAIILRPAAGNIAADFVAKMPHRRKVFQNRFPQFIHDKLEIYFEFQRIQFQPTTWMPCVEEFLTVTTEVYTDVTII